MSKSGKLIIGTYGCFGNSQKSFPVNEGEAEAIVSAIQYLSEELLPKAMLKEKNEKGDSSDG